MEADHREKQQASEISNNSRNISDNLPIRSCTGVLHYKFDVNSQYHSNPRCYGISLLLQRAPRGTKYNGIKAIEEEDIVRSFHYTCVGQSIYRSTPDGSPIFIEDKDVILLPACGGMEYVSQEREPFSDDDLTDPDLDADDVPDLMELDLEQEIHYRLRRWPHPSESSFLDRFIRNADLIASKVARNLSYIGEYAKEAMYDIIRRNKKRNKPDKDKDS